MALDTTETTSSVSYAPLYSHNRQVRAVETVSALGKTAGLNCARFRNLNVQVVPTSGADVSIQVYFWSDTLGHWIAGNPPRQVASAGAGVPYEFSFDVNGRIVLIACDAGSAFAAASDGADIYVSGSGHEIVGM